MDKNESLKRKIEILEDRLEDYARLKEEWCRLHEEVLPVVKPGLRDVANSGADALISEYKRVKAAMDDAEEKASQAKGMQKGLERAIAILAWESTIRSRNYQQISLPQSVP